MSFNINRWPKESFGFPPDYVNDRVLYVFMMGNIDFKFVKKFVDK